MIESPVLEEVKEIIRVSAAAATLRDVAFNFLGERFGEVPEDTPTKLAAISDIPRLKALTRSAVICPDLAAFAAQL